MKHVALIGQTRITIFILFIVLLIATLSFNRVIHTGFIPNDSKYLAKELPVVIVSGSVETLWNSIDYHFGEALRDSKDPGVILQGIRTIQDSLADRGLTVDSLNDIENYGLNITTPNLLGLMPNGNESDLVAIVKSNNKTTLLDQFAILLDTEQRQVITLSGKNSPDKLITTKMENLFIGDADTNTLIVSNKQKWLQSGYFQNTTNEKHWLNNDTLYQSIKTQLRKPLGSEATLFGYWNSYNIPLINQITALLEFDKKSIRLDASIDFRKTALNLRLIKSLLQTPLTQPPWQHLLPYNTVATFSIQDQNLEQYIGYLEREKEMRRWIKNSYGGVLSELTDVKSLERLVLAVTGYDQGLPELLMGVWGDHADLQKIMTRIQHQAQKKRNHEILQGALSAYHSVNIIDTLSTTLDSPTSRQEKSAINKPHDIENRATQQKNISIKNLRDNQLLHPESVDLFDHYSILNGEITGTITMHDLENPGYTYNYNGMKIRFLTPLISKNDIAYRKEFSELELTSINNDHRLAYAFSQDVLWIASNAKELESLLDRAHFTEGHLGNNPAYQTATKIWQPHDKIQGFINVDRAAALGLLSPESGINNHVKELLKDLGQHPSLSFALSGHGNSLELRTSMVKREAIKN